MSIEKDILKLLEERKTWVFCIKDMLIFGDYKSVAKAIERLTAKGTIDRISQGIYYYPLFNKTFNAKFPPDINDIVEAIGRNNNWTIRETGSTALYRLGLDNQIPYKFIYISSGPYRKYVIGNTTIELKKSSIKNFAFSRINSLVIQGLKTIGEDRITTEHIQKISNLLSCNDKQELIKQMNSAPIWMHKYIKKIGE